MSLTGNPICDAMAEIKLDGNITPLSWFHTVIKPGDKKSYLLAITILADIVYWYRPALIRDEASGAIVGYKKKFRSDLLQRNYKQIAEAFCVSVYQAKEAVRFLEALGVIRRVIRDVEVAAGTLTNVMFIELNPVRLMELTHPSVEIPTEGCVKSHGGVGKNPTEGDVESHGWERENPTEEVETGSPPPAETARDTEITPKISSRISAKASFDLSTGGVMDFAKSEKKDMYAKIAELCELEHHRKYGFCPHDTEREPARLPTYEMAIECLAEMCCAGAARCYPGNAYDPDEVWEKVQTVVDHDQTLCYFLEEVMEAFLGASNSTVIQNMRGYMRAVIWDHLHTYIARSEISCGV